MFFIYSAPDLERAVKSLEDILGTSKNEIESLFALEKKCYANFIKPYQHIFEKIEWFFTPLSILNSTKNNKEIQDVYTKILPLLSEFDTDVKQDIRLFETFKDILKSEKGLSGEQKKVLENEIIDIELTGVSLAKDKKARMKEINKKLSELSNRFSQNVLDATNAYELIVEDINDLKELPASDLALAKQNRDEKEIYRFTLHGPSFVSFMTYSTNRSLREKMYRAYTTRAPQNDAILEEILKLRDEKAKLLGFNNYAELSLKRKMANSPDEVLGFLDVLAEKSLPQARKELQSLKEFAAGLGCEDLQSHDVAYYSKKLEAKSFDFDEEKYRPYFEKKNTIGGLFDFLCRLFGITFKKTDEKTWDEKAVSYILEKSGKPFAKIYIDLETRDDKQGGAWMGDWRAHAKTLSGEIQFPIAYIVCNFPASTNEQPSLLKHDDVVTLFHEMGHALHHLLSRAEEPFVSGIAGVEWDAVEFPSQFLENFAYEKSVLKLFAKHYETDQTLPDEMIDKLIDAKNFQSALSMLRQLEFGLFDINIHMGQKSAEEVHEILNQIREKTSLLKPPEYNRFEHGFTHIFSGGYAAGYYSYKWAEVLSADAFYRFVDNGIFDGRTSKSFIDNVLSRGGMRSAMDNFKAFMKREPDPSALIRLSGID